MIEIFSGDSCTYKTKRENCTSCGLWLLLIGKTEVQEAHCIYYSFLCVAYFHNLLLVIANSHKFINVLRIQQS